MPRRRNIEADRDRTLAALERRLKVLRSWIAAQKDAAAFRELLDERRDAVRRRRMKRALAKEHEAMIQARLRANRAGRDC
ncbi:MAG: hypothetical protein ACE5FO_01420 [Parvularculaceae bacterium]